MIRIYSGNPYSRGARRLAHAMGVRRIRHTNSHWRGGPEHTVINWGATEVPLSVQGSYIMNTPDAIIQASDKLNFFQILRDKRLTPSYTESEETAQSWVDDGSAVVSRSLLRASGGLGIHITDPGQEVLYAPLHVRYIKKDSEWRVHVIAGDIVDIQKKAKRNEVDDPDWRVRNLQGGFIYMREGINIPHQVTTVAHDVFRKFSLDFGAIDIIFNNHYDRAYALEINTAPGLEGQTVDSYASALKGLI